MKSGVQPTSANAAKAVGVGLNAMKSGVQQSWHHQFVIACYEFECDEERSATLSPSMHLFLFVLCLNAMKSGVFLNVEN